VEKIRNSYMTNSPLWQALKTKTHHGKTALDKCRTNAGQMPDKCQGEMGRLKYE